jgi:ATP synthase protein I
VPITRPSLQALSYSTVGLELVFSVLLGALGGRWLDGKFGTAPVLTLLGLGFGVAAGARFVYRAWRRMQRETEQDGFRESDTHRGGRR